MKPLPSSALPNIKVALLSGAISLSLLSPLTHASGVSGSLNDFFNGLGYANNVTNPAAFKGQSANYYSGGNLFVRSPMRDAQLISV